MDGEFISQEDWEKLEEYDKVIEINFKVAEFQIAHERAPNDLTITILRRSNGEYFGISNYRYWGPKQGGPYRSLTTSKTVKDALDDALRGLLIFDNPEYPEDVVFWQKADTVPSILIDGTGNVVEEKEARRRRDEYDKKTK